MSVLEAASASRLAAHIRGIVVLILSRPAAATAESRLGYRRFLYHPNIFSILSSADDAPTFATKESGNDDNHERLVWAWRSAGSDLGPFFDFGPQISQPRAAQ